MILSLRKFKKPVRIHPLVYMAIIVLILVIMDISYSKDRFIIFDKFYLIEKDTSSAWFGLNNSKFQATPVEPIQTNVFGSKLYQYICSDTDTLFEYDIIRENTLLALNLSYFQNVDLSKTKFIKSLSDQEPGNGAYSVVAQGIDFEYLTRLPKNDFESIVIKIPKSATITESYTSNDSCHYILKSRWMIIKSLGKRDGHIFYKSKNNNSSILVEFNRKQNGKLNISVGNSIKGAPLYKLTMRDVIKIVAK